MALADAYPFYPAQLMIILGFSLGIVEGKSFVFRGEKLFINLCPPRHLRGFRVVL